MSTEQHHNPDTKHTTISIITVCRNAQSLIKSTVKSVRMQTYPDIEYVVIDGKSTDRTLDLVRENSNDSVKIISEKDRGIYDAMNKGVRNATGEIIYFINAGDILDDRTTIEKVMIFFSDHPEAELVYGDVVYYSRSSVNRTRKKIENVHISINHQCLFARRELFDAVGMFNTDYIISADYDWVLRCLIHQRIKPMRIGIPICHYLLGGLSSTMLTDSSTSRKIRRERLEVIDRNVPWPFLFSGSLNLLEFAYLLKGKISHIFMKLT